MTESKRIVYLDATKGFAIFLMVFAHIIAWNFEDYTQVVWYDVSQPINVKVAGFLWQVIYAFHMPLFFLISGFLAYRMGGGRKCWSRVVEEIKTTPDTISCNRFFDFISKT